MKSINKMDIQIIMDDLRNATGHINNLLGNPMTNKEEDICKALEYIVDSINKIIGSQNEINY